jgi:gliding motility-associated-like protein
LAVTVDPVVSVSVSINDPGPTCAGDLMTFTASPVNEGSSPSYQWLVDGNPMATGNPFSTTSLSDGNQVKAVLTSSIACTSGSPATSNTITVSVSSNVTPSVTLSGPASICSDSIATYTASSSGGGGSPTYQWILDGSNYGAPTGSNTFSNPLLSSGSHNVHVLMTTSLSCATSSTATSNTISFDVKSIPSPSINESDMTVCSGDVVTLTASSGGGTLQWYTNATVSASGSSYTVPTSAAGSFSITVNENNGSCNTTSSPVTVTVVSTPVAFAGPDLHINEGEMVTLNASGGAFYSWSPATGLSDPAIANPTVTPTGLMTLTVTVSNGGLCTSSDQMTIYVTKPVLIPNAFSPNGDNLHDVFILKNIDVYPEAVLSVYNQWGELIYKSDPGYPEPWDGTRNGKPLPVSAYVYVLQLNSPDVDDLTGSVTILK